MVPWTWSGTEDEENLNVVPLYYVCGVIAATISCLSIISSLLMIFTYLRFDLMIHTRNFKRLLVCLSVVDLCQVCLHIRVIGGGVFFCLCLCMYQRTGALQFYNNVI